MTVDVDRVRGLVDQATERSAIQPALREAWADLIASELRAAGLQFQAVVRPHIQLLDPAAIIARMVRITQQVCRVEYDGAPIGTGMLVGPDLVLTNHHVVRDALEGTADPTKLAVRFDYGVRVNGVANAGVEFRLAEDWCVDASPPGEHDLDELPEVAPTPDELDYALLRVQGTPGFDAASSRHRGWLEPSPRRLEPGEPLYIVQHPEGDHIKLAQDPHGVLGYSENGLRIRYATTTNAGSSGSPCFDQHWNLVALHHAGDPRWGTPKFNQGIPIGPIFERIRATTKLEMSPAPPTTYAYSPGDLVSPRAEPEVPDATDRRAKVFLVVPHDQADTVARLTAALETLARDFVIVGRRVVPPSRDVDVKPDPRALSADVAIVVASRGLALSSYAWSREARQLIERQRDGGARVLVVDWDRTVIADTPLADAPHTSASDLSPDVLRSALAGKLSAAALDLDDYLAAVETRVAREERIALDTFVEPPKRGPAGATHDSLEDLLGRQPNARLAIVAAPAGGGKTVLVRRFLVAMLANAKTSAAARIPIYFALREWRGGTLLETIERSLGAATSAERWIAPSLLQKATEGRLLFVLDGLDEMPRATLHERLAEIEALASKYAGCRFIITSRTEALANRKVNGLRIDLDPWSKEEIALVFERIAGLSKTDARAETTLLMNGGAFQDEMRTPLFLALIAEYRRDEGRLPNNAIESFDAFVRRAVARLGPTPHDVLDDLGLLANELAEAAGVGGVVAAPLVIERIANKITRGDPLSIIETALESRLVRRIGANGELGFDHVYVQELVIARWLAALSRPALSAWLLDHASDPIASDQFQLLGARRDAADLEDFFVALCDRIDRCPADAPEQVRGEHDTSLVLAAKLGAPAGLAAERFANTLARWWALAEQRPATVHVRRQILDAARGPVVREPLLPHVTASLRSRHSSLRRAAMLAMESVGERGSVTSALVRQSVAGNYVYDAPGDRAFIAEHPRLQFLRPWVGRTLAIHIAILVLVPAIAVAVYPTSMLLVLPLLLLNLVSPLWSRDGTPSTLEWSARSVVLALLVVLTRWIPDGIAGAVSPSELVHVESINLPLVMVMSGMFSMFAGMSSRARAVLRPWGLVGCIGVAGGAVLAALAVPGPIPWWATTSSIAILAVGIAVALLLLARVWGAKKLAGGVVLVAAVGGAMAGFDWIGDHAGMIGDIVKFGIGGFLLLGTLLGALGLLGVNVRSLVRGDRSCTLAEASSLLQNVANDDLVAVARRRAVRRLAHVTPCSRVVREILFAMQTFDDWKDDAALQTAVRKLDERLAKAGTVRATAAEERDLFERTRLPANIATVARERLATLLPPDAPSRST